MQTFHRSANSLAKISIAVVVIALGALGWLGLETFRSPYVTHEGEIHEQPVVFSHEHHVAGLGLDCRYCHTSVEKSNFAGLPPSSTCINCHRQIWTNADLLAPVRESYATNTPLRWNRVHDLPDFVYFNHSIHIAKGVGCTTCHGSVETMSLTWKGQSLFMSWCLDCHRNPGPKLRPVDKVFDPFWKRGPNTPPPDELVKVNHVVTTGLTDCSTCHR